MDGDDSPKYDGKGMLDADEEEPGMPPAFLFLAVNTTVCGMIAFNVTEMFDTLMTVVQLLETFSKTYTVHTSALLPFSIYAAVQVLASVTCIVGPKYMDQGKDDAPEAEPVSPSKESEAEVMMGPPRSDQEVVNRRAATSAAAVEKPKPKVKDRYCTTCKACQPLRTVHCTDCKRCIQAHDFHCVWLGICVSETNFALFCITVALTLIECCVFLYIGFNSLITEHSFHDEGWPFLLGALVALFAILCIYFVMAGTTIYASGRNWNKGLRGKMVVFS